MNDFTKEELKDIINWGDVYTEFGNSWTNKVHRPLIEKIQSMIDKYCEHEWRNNCCGCCPSNICCKKCDICLSGDE